MVKDIGNVKKKEAKRGKNLNKGGEKEDFGKEAWRRKRTR